MTLPVDPAVHHLKDGNSTALVSLVKITKTNGTAIRVCNADRQVVFEGELYDPDDSPNLSAIEMKEGLDSHDRSGEGIISSDAITLEDLRKGLYEGALVEEFIVDRRFSWLGALQRRKYRISEMSFDDRGWSGNMEGFLGRLTAVRGITITRTCRFSLGDSDCGIDLSHYRSHALTVGDVSAPNNTRTKFEATDPLYVAARDASWSNFGTVEFLTGSLAGFTLELKSESRSGSDITFDLQNNAPADIAVGDLFEIVAGCDRTKNQCKTKFDNIVNFGGFPSMPGADRSYIVVDSGK